MENQHTVLRDCPGELFWSLQKDPSIGVHCAGGVRSCGSYAARRTPPAYSGV